MTSTINEDPAAIEREIRRTQENMSATVEKIGDQLSIKNLFNAMLDKAEDKNIDAKMLIDGARRNPVALGLIAAGAIWLVSDKDSKLPSLPSKTRKTDSDDLDSFDPHHRDYVSHMSAVEQRADEEMLDYQRRRDMARSNFFMIERNQDENDSSFRQRLDAMTDKFSQKRRAWAESTGEITGNISAAAKEKTQAATGKAKDMYTDNPLVAGILAAAVGAVCGSALPVTRQEQDKLGSLGAQARKVVSEHKEQVVAQVREKKDEMLDKADEAINKSPQLAQIETL